jgi:hypothetical protein
MVEISERRAWALEVAYCLDVIAELPAWVERPSLPAAAQNACLESFYSNLRALIEFLVMVRDDKRIHRHDFLPGWEPPEDHTDLKKLFGMTSTHVSHLGKGRIVTPGEAEIDVSPATLAAQSAAVLRMMHLFCDTLVEAGDPEAEVFAAGLDVARARLAR